MSFAVLVFVRAHRFQSFEQQSVSAGVRAVRPGTDEPDA